MIHIACIEPDSQSRFTFEQIAVLLRASGYPNVLHFYQTPQEALDAIPQERPDYVFLDSRQHGPNRPNGLDLVRALRQHPLCRGVILVAMAEYAMPGDSSAALAAGCHEFVPKPLRYQSVADIVTRKTHPSAV